jgi:Zn-dependent protease
MPGLPNIDWGMLLIQMAVLIFSLSIHESAHAWTADLFGDPTARYLGRVTLNPLPHIDPVGTILFPLIAAISGIPLLGWAKPTPVNPLNLRNPRRDNIFISAAGPFSNILAGIGFFIGLKLIFLLYKMGLPLARSVLEPLVIICTYGVMINFILAAFNLIPLPPLDGSGVLAGLLPHDLADAYDKIRPYGFILLMLLLYLGVLSKILRPVFYFIGLLLKT